MVRAAIGPLLRDIIEAATISVVLRGAVPRADTSGCAPRPSLADAATRPPWQAGKPLLGQIVNHYRAQDDPAGLPALLEAVHDIPASMDPFRRKHLVIPRSLIAAIRDLPKVCKLHLPVVRIVEGHWADAT